MTREEYKTQRLGAKIGELNAQIVDLEFAVQYLQEENAKLKEENQTLSEKVLEPDHSVDTHEAQLKRSDIYDNDK